MDCDLDETKATRNREKSADEMFEELGYHKEEYDNEDIYYYQLNVLCERYGFQFIKNEKEIYPVCESYIADEPISITMQELKAINKKCIEMGWI